MKKNNTKAKTKNSHKFKETKQTTRISHKNKNYIDL